MLFLSAAPPRDVLPLLNDAAGGLGLARDGLLVFALLALAWTDLRRGILPNACVLPAGLAGLVLSGMADPDLWWIYPTSALGVGAALLALAAAHPGGLGMGDVKMGGMIGAFMGPYAFVAVFLGALGGTIVAGALMVSGRIGRRTPLPFGAFMAAGGIVTLIYGHRILGWYAAVG